MGDETPAAIDRMETVATVLDSGLEIPVIGVKVGIDPILGILPGAGDLTAAALSLTLVGEAARQGVSTTTLARMILNVALDTTIGMIPVVGGIFDVFWRANDRNVRLAKRDLGVE